MIYSTLRGSLYIVNGHRLPSTKIEFCSLKIDLVLANCVDPNEM